MQIKSKLGKEIKSGKVSRGVPYRLLQLIRMHKRKDGYHPALPARISQYLYRVVGDVNDKKDNELARDISKKIEDIISDENLMKGVGMKIVEVALNWCALEMREKGKEEEK